MRLNILIVFIDGTCHVLISGGVIIEIEGMDGLDLILLSVFGVGLFYDIQWANRPGDGFYQPIGVL